MQNGEHVHLTLDRAMRLAKEAFLSATERDVYTGDALRICTVTKEGIGEGTVPLWKACCVGHVLELWHKFVLLIRNVK